ncbi:LigB subunit of an aromatic-ring-opening dioxygenase LigAB [Myriangium duriaei CBS 260.36]|uniref:LigB subunit of an aromatic-ring-opening dioxygenase LigAB n=1 Tax=Myriangium duriaei CBS 260.36 TaxID=1168546 RepID=A0A9P4IZP6_9PEZI|nr:LigB subunit of an aromatic-ring-opening dioxygenase LigAB [Myriangium duriaei CBS 260.36]
MAIHATPVHFFSHGSTMMLGEESESADYWKKCGDAALAHGIKGVVMMGAHWDSAGDVIEVAANPKPAKSPVAYVDPAKYKSYELNPDMESVPRVLALLEDAGFNAKANDKFDWIHDTYLILIRMFPDGCPPTTIVSMNASYDPHYHMRVGSALRPLREQGFLLIGTGGAVHNLYRNEWQPMIRYRDNFAQIVAPEKPLMEFRQSVEDCFLNNKGPALRRAITRLMKHPQYRDAHGTDDHFMSACYVAGAAGDWADEEMPGGSLGAETWELSQMCNSQFTIGSWNTGDQRNVVSA